MFMKKILKFYEMILKGMNKCRDVLRSRIEKLSIFK